MFNKIHIWGIVGFAIIAICLFTFVINQKTTDNKKQEIVSGGWIKVSAGQAYIVGTDGNKKEIFSGDTISEGDNIEISKDGRVAINLSDGSVLRASDGAKFFIKTAEYNKSSGKLVLEASLQKGRIWSKIIELATPDSLWSVKTSNTVATVRGSAFGISTDGTTSQIIGSQHKVFVALVDPRSGNKLNKESVVDENFKLEISNEAVEKLKQAEDSLSANPSSLNAKSAFQETEKLFVPVIKNDEIKKEDWVMENEADDKKIEEDLKIIKDNAGDNKNKFRDLLIRMNEERLGEIKNRVVPEIKEDVKPSDKEKEKEPISEIKKEENRDISESKRIEVVKTIDKIPAPAEPKWRELILKNSGILAGITEGSPVSFRAILKSDRGEEKDVTESVKWQVLGPVGKIEKPGLFYPELDLSVSDLGEGFGYVLATWKGDDGVLLLGKSEQIQVLLKGDDGASAQIGQ